MQRRRIFWLLMPLLILLAVWYDYASNSVLAKELPLKTLAVEISSTRSTVTLPQRPPETCPLSKPQEPAFIPPPPYPDQAGEGSFWYGTEALWVKLRSAGTWSHLPYRQGGYVQKILWWSKGFDPYTEPQPDFTTTLRRLDVPGKPIVRSGASHGFHPDLVSFIVGGAHVPSPGCWEITGQYQGTELSFVVWLAP